MYSWLNLYLLVKPICLGLVKVKRLPLSKTSPHHKTTILVKYGIMIFLDLIV